MSSLPPASEPRPVPSTQAAGRRDPLPLKVQPRPARPPRDGLLRVTLFCIILGALLTLISSVFLVSYSRFDEYLYVSASVFHHVLVPVFCALAIIGVLLLDRVTVLGLLLVLGSALLVLLGGGAYLFPGAVLAAIWAVRHDMTARLMLGFLLLVPGVIAVYYSLAGLVSFYTRQPLPGMPISLSPPLHMTDALQPMRLLPLALIGAWLLTDGEREPASGE